MTIQFNHKGETITAKVLWFPTLVTDVMILFPDSCLGELGWKILLTKIDDKWETDSYLTDKYPATSLDILSQINIIETNLKNESLK